MKHKIFALIFFLLFIISVDKINAKINIPLTGKIIVVDPGHGGKDPGTSSAGILEKDVNLKISLYLEEELSKRGAIVLLIRDGDYDLSSPDAFWRKKSDFNNRIKLINESKADLYLSIHLNFLPQSKYSGPQVFYNEKDENNKKYAQIIQEVLNNELKKSREIKKIPNDTYMYEKLERPGVLIECGFLSNPTERNKLNSEEYQREIAQIIAEAIEKLF